MQCLLSMRYYCNCLDSLINFSNSMREVLVLTVLLLT